MKSKTVFKETKHFIKMELHGWSFWEIFSLTVVFFIIGTNALLFDDSIAAVISALCGILYTFIAGKGKISCYFFGLLGSGFYVYLAFKNALYGNAILYAGYYIPMQIVGIVKWREHLKWKSQEIYKTSLGLDDSLQLLVFSLMGCAGAIFILKLLHDPSPVIDGITTVLSLAGMYLTVRRCIEQWGVWIIVNTLSIMMWLKAALHGEKVYSTIVMWAVYFILGIYFYIKWHNELEKEQEEKHQVLEQIS